MTIKVWDELTQGSVEWLEARRGKLCASEMKLIVTPTLKIAANEKERAHLYELLAQRITGHVEPHYIGDDMLRGFEDEIKARDAYSKNYAPVEQVGFITNDWLGFPIGYSPDGKIIGKRAGIEAKSRRQRFQVQTILENVVGEDIPADYVIQVQTGLMVAEWEFIDFLSYSGGLPMAVIRVHPDPQVQAAIEEAACAFEARLVKKFAEFEQVVNSRPMVATERTIEQEMFV